MAVHLACQLSNLIMTEDSFGRLNGLLSKYDQKIQSQFISAVNSAKSSILLNTLSDLLESGNFDTALRIADQIPLSVTTQINFSIVETGNNTSNLIAGLTTTPTFFDQTNQAAVNFMQQNRSRFIREFTAEQRNASTSAIVDGIRRGLNPKEQARNFRQSIGLTENQVRAVSKYRELLETNDKRALSRSLRDRRFDRTVLNAINQEKSISKLKIDKMVNRYRERYLKYRSEVIGRTEALRSVNQANNLAFQQAIESGTLDENDLIKTWHTSGLPNIRDSHELTNGQEVPFNQPFVTGAGNLLMFPGDPNGPAEEVIQCRCIVTTRLKGT